MEAATRGKEAAASRAAARLPAIIACAPFRLQNRIGDGTMTEELDFTPEQRLARLEAQVDTLADILDWVVATLPDAAVLEIDTRARLVSEALDRQVSADPDHAYWLKIRATWDAPKHPPLAVLLNAARSDAITLLRNGISGLLGERGL
jgi:hypothetical protein